MVLEHSYCEVDSVPFHNKCLMFIMLISSVVIAIPGASATEPTGLRYLLFHIFLGGPDFQSGTFHRGRSQEDIRRIARQISDTVRPERTGPDRILGFAIGPIATDEGEDEARSVIREAFDVALATDMAVALHLDDYMFWGQARLPDGSLLRNIRGTSEWRDWSGTPAGGLEIGWLPKVKLPPQICYENSRVRDYSTYWVRDVIGQELKKQLEKLARAGKTRLFAGVIVGWESNLAYGYCSLSNLGYTSEKPPADFDRERERILQRHIEVWAKGIYDLGIPRNLIFTHIGPISKRDYEKLAAMPRSQMRDIHQSTAFRAFWTAFNPYSNPGFSAYPDEGRFEDIYEAVRAYDAKSWAIVEGTNVVPGAAAAGRPGQSDSSWETYLARAFNHGAAMVNIFGGFAEEGAGPIKRSTESEEALNAYRKFLRGDRLVEDTRR